MGKLAKAENGNRGLGKHVERTHWQSPVSTHIVGWSQRFEHGGKFALAQSVGCELGFLEVTASISSLCWEAKYDKSLDIREANSLFILCKAR